jgi:hypothetical protein
MEDKIKDSVAGKLLLEALDTVYDVGLYESAHAFSLGNKERGAALLAALDRGEAPPPGPYALSSPNVGLTLRHRLILSLPTATPTPAANTWATSWLSLALSPLLEGYVRGLLPNPNGLSATITWRNAAGETVVGSDTVNLVGWDVLQFIRDAVDPAQLQGSPFARRLAARAGGGVGASGNAGGARAGLIGAAVGGGRAAAWRRALINDRVKSGPCATCTAPVMITSPADWRDRLRAVDARVVAPIEAELAARAAQGPA